MNISPKYADKWVRFTTSPTGIRGNLVDVQLYQDQYANFQQRINKKYKGHLNYADDAGIVLGEKNKLLQILLNTKIRELLSGQITTEKAYEEIISKCQ